MIAPGARNARLEYQVVQTSLGNGVHVGISALTIGSDDSNPVGLVETQGDRLHLIKHIRTRPEEPHKPTRRASATERRRRD